MSIFSLVDANCCILETSLDEIPEYLRHRNLELIGTVEFSSNFLNFLRYLSNRIVQHNIADDKTAAFSQSLMKRVSNSNS